MQSHPKHAESSTGRPDSESSIGKKRRGAGSSKGKDKARQHEDTEMSELDDEAESSSRHWVDRNTTLKDLPTPIFQDSDDEESFELSESTSELLAAAFTRTLPNAERRKLRQEFQVPRVEHTRFPKLDAIFKTAESGLRGEAKSAETDLARIQALVLVSVWPVLQALEGIRDGSLTFDDADHAVSSAIALLGNASSHISKLRRKKVPKELNPDIQDLAEDDSKFVQAAPKLFGVGFEKTMKERAESLKLLKSSTKKTSEPRQKPFFFRQGRPSRPHRGGGFSTRGRRGHYQPYQPYHRPGGKGATHRQDK